MKYFIKELFFVVFEKSAAKAMRESKLLKPCEKS